jgi:histidyl-tRNA synthetase
MGIPYVLIVGERDLAGKQVTIREMKSGTEKKVPLGEIAAFPFD